jgi:hypothetical protein
VVGPYGDDGMNSAYCIWGGAFMAFFSLDKQGVKWGFCSFAVIWLCIASD